MLVLLTLQKGSLSEISMLMGTVVSGEAYEKYT